MKVTDKLGASATSTTKIVVGNDMPQLDIVTNSANNFYWKVFVNDKQDGNTKDGSIDANNVQVTFSYIPQGRDIVKATIGHQQIIDPEGKTIIENADCKACHAVDKKVNGPSYKEIAEKYNSKD